MRARILRALVALIVAVGSVGLAVSQGGFSVVAAAIGVRVGVPGAFAQLARAVLPIVVALLVAVLAIRFGIRALRTKVTLAGDLARGGKLLSTVVWAGWTAVVVELLYRQFWLGWTTLFGNLGASLAWSAAVVVLCFVADRLVPWTRVPRGVRNVGLFLFLAVGLLTAFSAWSHRDVVPKIALIPVAVVGLALGASGVRRVEAGPRTRMLVELALASALLSGPLWGLLA